MNKFYRSLLLTGSFAAVLAGCGDDVTITEPPPPPPPPTPTVRSITVGPDGGSVTVGATLNMTAAVNADAGVATTVTWTSSDNAKATVSATGVVTGVAVGSVGVRACSTANTSVCGVATVNVVAAPVAVVTGVTVTPPAATLVIGQQITATATVQGTNSPAQAVTWSSLAPSIATVDAGGVVTAVANGVAVIKATSNANSSIAGTLSVTVFTPQPSTISIQSITTGGLNTPVTLTNVGGQIEISLNVDNGAYTITKAQALIGGVVVAEQSFASSSADAAPAAVPSTVVLSTNTRQLAKVGSLYVPVIFNGPNAITAQIFVAGSSSPISTNAILLTMNNADAMVVTPTVTLAPATLTPTVSSWYTGNVNVAGGNYISFATTKPTFEWNGSACAASTDTLTLTGSPTTGLTTSGSLDCGTIETTITLASYTAGATTQTAVDIPQTVADGTYSGVGSVYTVNGASRYNLVGAVAAPAPTGVKIDNKAPTVTADTVAFNTSFDEAWINGSYDFVASAFAAFTDGGVGEKASTKAAWAGANGIDVTGDCTLATTSISTGADLAETLTSDGSPDGYTICIQGADSLGNTSDRIAGTNWFGVDKTAPTARFLSNIAALPTGTISAVSSTANTTIETIAAPHTNTDVFAVEAIDGRSGFHQGGAIAGFPVNQVRTRFNPTNDPSTTCTAVGSTLPTVLVDNYVRSLEFDANCLDNVATIPGYYTWSAYVTDRAGNQSSTLSRNYAKDDLARADITTLAPAQLTYAPGTAAAFNVWGSDDLELIEGTLLVVYDNNNDGTREHAVRYPYSMFPIGTRWDATLTNTVSGSSLTIASLIGRIDSVSVVDSLPFANASYATGGAAAPDSVWANLRDVASQADNTPLGIALDSLTQFSAKTVAAWQNTAGIFDQVGNRTWSGATSGGNKVATLETGTSVTAPYFDSVNLYGLIGGELVFCGTMGTPTMADNGVYRVWQYSVTTPAGSNACTGAGNWYVGGVKGNAVLLSVVF